ncbi:MAG: hypothetical protein E7498_05605 [Ruminococcus sp.]|nr:hypothetical protein [Ruminococcus sp.]
MYCKNCGQEIRNEAVVCVHCGCSVEKKEPLTEDKISAAIVILSLIIPLVGIIMGIINICKSKFRSGGIYLAIAIIMCIFNTIFLFSDLLFY